MPSRANILGAIQVNTEGQDNTYAAGLDNNAPAATPTDVAFLQGVASKVVKVSRIVLSFGATASGAILYNVVKRVGGTQTVADTPFVANTHGALYDSANPASAVIAAAQSGIYTANRTNGTLAGYIDSFTGTLLANAGLRIVFDFGNRPSQMPTLRGATENLCVTGNGHTVLAGEKFGVVFEWIEF